MPEPTPPVAESASSNNTVGYRYVALPDGRVGRGPASMSEAEILARFGVKPATPEIGLVDTQPTAPAIAGFFSPGAAATTVILAMLIGLWAFASRSKKSRQNRNAFFEASISGLVECLDFWGRTSRADYWRFQLFAFLVCGSVSFIEGWVNGGAGGTAMILNALFWLPGLSLSARRRHDLGLEAYPFILCGFAVAVLCLVGILDSNEIVISLGGISLVAWLVWWLFWVFKRGEQGDNRFGPQPQTEPSNIQPTIADIDSNDTPITSSSEQSHTTDPMSAGATTSRVETRPEPTDPYKLAGQEILSGQLEAAAWARALVEGNGVEGAVRAAYVKLRVGAIKAETAQLQKSMNESIKNAEFIRNYAAAQGITLADAEKMMPLGVKKDGEKYFFVGKSDGKAWFYENLADAIWAAEHDL